MKRLWSAAFVLVFACASALLAKDAAKPFAYPEAPKSDQVDEYHGTKVADPYRPLENADSPETRAWIEAQNKIALGYLSAIPERKKINERLTKLWNYEKFGVPFREGERFFFSKNTGLQNQSVQFMTTELPGTPKAWLDPNTLSKDGTTAVTGVEVSPDGKLVAYGLAVAGSDWQEWRVREIETGKDREDVVKWVKFAGASWNAIGTGFYYSRYNEPAADQLKAPNFYHKVYFHQLGSPQSEDVLIYERTDHKDWLFNADVTEDGQYLVINVAHASDPKNRVFYKTLGGDVKPVVELLNKADAEYDFVGNDGPVFWFRTNLGAPRGRVIAIDTTKPEEIRELVPQSDDKLNGVKVVGDRFIANYLKDAHSVVRLFELTGAPAGEIALPGLGSASGFTGKRKHTETFYNYVSYTEPPTVFRYDLETNESKPLFRPTVDFKSEDFTTEQVFYNSKDGTRVPMFLTYRKGLQKDGNNPAILYGYGGFNSSQTPTFTPTIAAWLQMGGIYAVANLRGGGEYGEEWHLAGTKLRKQNTFDDFIAAGEWLIANNYTSTPKLAASGRSNGGLLVGAVLNQRPDLWGAALPTVGVMDMLRFHTFTIGWAWVADYGSSENREEFDALIRFSPLHNVKPGTKYPPTLITTADHDDRVFPGHSFKYAAAMQAAQAGPAPVLIRIETRAGHGSGKPVSKQIEDVTDQLTFLVKNLAMKLAL